MLIKGIFIGKKIGDIISVGPHSLLKANMDQVKENKKDQMVIEIAQKNIIKEVSSQITFNIMDIDNLKICRIHQKKFAQKLVKM